MTGIGQVLDRTCVMLEAKNDDQTERYKYTIDLYTGILLDYEEFDNNDTLTGYIRVSELSVDKGVDVKKYDESKYTTELGYTYR